MFRGAAVHVMCERVLERLWNRTDQLSVAIGDVNFGTEECKIADIDGQLRGMQSPCIEMQLWQLLAFP